MKRSWDSVGPPRRRAWIFILIALCAVFIFCFAPAMWNRRAEKERVRLLSEGIRRAAVQCYALEGFYPPSLDYLMRHYGIEPDETHCLINYQYVASNLMPEISVIPIS